MEANNDRTKHKESPAFILRRAGYREFPPGAESERAASAWERRVEGAPEYAEGEGRFCLYVYVTKSSLPGAHTFTVEAYGATGKEQHSHKISSYNLRVDRIGEVLEPAERRVLAGWKAIAATEF